MNNRSKHTPTPWRLRQLVNRTFALYGQGEYEIVFPKANQDEPDMDAAFIVKAVNSHEALVSALKKYVKLDNDYRSGCEITAADWAECNFEACAALAVVSESEE